MTSDHVSGRLSGLDRRIVQAVPAGGNWRNLPHNFPSKRIEQIRLSAAAGQGSRSTYYGRLRWDYPSYTISTYFNRPGNGCYIHPSAERLITVREAARLQSFPDEYRFSGAGRNRFVQVGNAVPPLLAYQLGLAIGSGTLVDLFAGAGGLSLGLEWAGLDTKLAVDQDQSAANTYRRNHTADVMIEADLFEPAEVARVACEARERLGRERLHVLAGGPPCQGFSTAGACRPDDKRNRLVFSFLEIADRLRPQVVVLENVAALLWRGRNILKAIRQRLRVLGYESEVALLHAEAYGVPQLRRRLFVIAARGQPVAWPRPWRRVFTPSHLDFQPGSSDVESMHGPFVVRDAIGDLPASEATSFDDDVEYTMDPTSEYQHWARGSLPLKEFVPFDLADRNSGLFTLAYNS